MKQKPFLIVAVLAVGLVALYVVLFNQPVADSVDQAAVKQMPASTTQALGRQAAAPTPDQVKEIGAKQAFFLSVGNMVNQRFGDRLGNSYWRVKMISDLMQLFKERYPNNWRAELEAFFRSQFPKLADDLIAKLEALLQYNEWLTNLKATMEFASIKERQAAMWEKRLALFGDEAYEIWEAALKNEQLQASLETVNNHVGSFSEKAELYRDSLKQIFGDQVIGEEAPHKTQKLTKFLELDSVQADLYALPESERYQALQEFRESIGMDEQALQRWQQLDEERAQVWANADIYMQQRQQLVEQYQGAELEQKLTQLQNELFGETEAQYIRNEEASGYFRFEKPQKIGLN